MVVMAVFQVQYKTSCVMKMLMKGTILLCAVATVCTLGYISVSHKAQAAQIASQILSDMNMIKVKVLSAVKSKEAPQIESALSGDLKNIENKMQKIQHTLAEAPGEEEKTATIQTQTRRTPVQLLPNLLENSIMNQIIEQYLRDSMKSARREVPKEERKLEAEQKSAITAKTDAKTAPEAGSREIHESSGHRYGEKEPRKNGDKSRTCPNRSEHSGEKPGFGRSKAAANKKENLQLLYNTEVGFPVKTPRKNFLPVPKMPKPVTNEEVPEKDLRDLKESAHMQDPEPEYRTKERPE